MTTFGGIIDGESNLPTISAPDSAVRPSSAAGIVTTVMPGVKPRLLDDRDVDESNERWRQSLQSHYERVLQLVRHHPSSMTLQARLADAAYMCGLTEEAIDACTATFVIALERASSADPDVPPLEIAAATVATRILRDLNRVDVIKRYADDLPNTGAVGLFKAQALLSDDGRLELVLDILNDLDADRFPVVHGLRGYVLLVLKKFKAAAGELRIAQRQNPQDVDAAMNLASAFWQLGSAQKATRWARYATRVAPGRYDALMALLGYLVETREFSAASDEIDQLALRGFADTPESAMIAAQVYAHQGDLRRASILLKKARSLAEQADDTNLVAELDGYIALFDLSNGRVDRMEALQKIRSAIRRAPSNTALVAMLADLLERTTDSVEVRRAFARLDRPGNATLVRAIECRLAFLEARFDDAAQLAKAWGRAEPLNARAVRLTTFWYGALYNQWEFVADIALAAVRQLHGEPATVNAAAYALALAGRAKEAVAVLKTVDHADYALTATAGLAHISGGDVKGGLALYRRAAQMADIDGSGYRLRSFMTLHQAMGLRHLGLADKQSDEMRASALPPIELPADWRKVADFRFLREVAARRGWEWPPQIS